MNSKLNANKEVVSIFGMESQPNHSESVCVNSNKPINKLGFSKPLALFSISSEMGVAV